MYLQESARKMLSMQSWPAILKPFSLFSYFTWSLFSPTELLASPVVGEGRHTDARITSATGCSRGTKTSTRRSFATIPSG